MRLAIFLALLCLAPLTACNCGDDNRTAAIGCEIDQDLVDERRACVADDECPCGTGCNLGECVADCTKNSDCDGSASCDVFGRCSTVASSERIPLLDPKLEGRIVASAKVIQLYDGTSARRVRLSAREANLGEVRALADDGLEVSCDDGSSFAAECRLPGLPIGDVATLRVRPTAEIPVGENKIVRVFTGSRRESISFTSDSSLAPLIRASGSIDVPVSVAGPLAGVYQGTAHLVATSISGSGEGGTPLIRRESVAITAEIHAAADTGAAVIVLRDEFANIAGATEVIGDLSIDGSGGGSVDFPTTLMHTGSVSFGDPVELLLDLPEVDVVSNDNGARTLSFSLQARTLGLLAGADAPTSHWGIALYRTGDLPGGASTPTVPADAVATLAVNRPAAGWEGAISAELRTLVAGPQHLFGRDDSVFETFEGRDNNLVACSLDDTDAASLRQSVMMHSLADFAELRQGRFRSENGEVEFDDATNLTIGTFTSPFMQMIAADMVQNPPTTGGFDLFTIPAAPPGSVGNRIPCAYSGGTASISASVDEPARCPLSSQFALDDGVPMDSCAQMASDYGCNLVDVPAGTVTRAMAGRTEMQMLNDACTYPVEFELDVIRECVFDDLAPRPAARRCGELTMCFELNSADTGREGALGLSSRLGASSNARTGDLECLGGAGEFTLAVDNTAGGTARALTRTSCLDNLARLQDEDPSVLNLSALFEDSACVDAARLLYAIGTGLDSARAGRVTTGYTVRADEETVAIRLLQRWVQLHGFLAQESVQTEQLAEVIRRDNPNDPGLPPGLEDVLTASLAGWELFLHPRFASGVAGLSGDVLASPDYREQIVNDFTDAQLGREQGDGLAVAMLETLNTQTLLATKRLERALRTGDQSALDSLREVLHYEQLVRPLAVDLYARADASATPVVWESRFISAEQRLTSSLGRMRATAIALQKGENPLGITDEDLPLYFFSDQTGPGGKFSAISDFLLGTSPASTSNFAPLAVRQATDSLQDARDAWVAFQSRETARAQSQSQLNERIEEINLRFAGELTSYCGTPGGLATVNVLEGWEGAQGEAFTADTCYFKKDEARCDLATAPWAELLSTDDILFQYCVADELRKRMGEDVVLRNPTFEQVTANFTECEGTSEFPVTCTINGVESDSCFRCRDGSVQFAPKPEDFINVYDGIATRVVDEARATCAGQFPNAEPQLPGLGEIDLPPLDDASCYRGSLGESALTVRAIAQDVEIARSELGEFQDRYDIAINSCLIEQLGNDRLEGAQSAHNSTMSQLRQGKLLADIAANAAAGVKDCASTAAGTTSPTQSGAAVASCGAAAVEATAESVSDVLQLKMDEAQQSHETLMTMIENDITEQKCFNDAEMELVGTQTATLRVQRAVADLQIAHFQMTEIKVLAQTAYDDGLASIAAANNRFVAPIAHDYWLDERLVTYSRRFRIAQRVSYLASRAVEYEFQQSLAASALILSAEVPEQLEEALDQLWTTAGTRRINGNAPSDLKIVVSLKKGLLQLADNADQPSGESQLTDSERFRLELQNPRYAVYDGEQRYLGQQVPFNIAPLEELGLGNTQGISIFARNSCAERMWSVNATIHGDENNVFIGDNPSFVDVQLLKSNTFFSQWCSPQGQETAFQEASVRPSRNLFADPGAGAIVGNDLGLQNEQLLFSRARMQAFFNIERDEFSQDDFANGDTSELAARGLYGQYAIFFPAGTLSTVQGNGSASDGLNLNAIDDIFLRIDYVSVAR